MAFTFDYVNQIIDSDAADITCQEIINAIRDAEDDMVGMGYPQIANASGKESLGGSVAVGITIELLDSWQIRFAAGNYVASITGGNLVGGPSGDPVAYSAGVQVLLLQSAASTVVTTGGIAATAAEVADAVWDEAIASHTAAGSTGEALDNVSGGSSPATIADAVWDEATSGHTTAGTFGKKAKDGLTLPEFLGLK